MFEVLCLRSAMKCLFNPLSACCLAIDATRSIAASLAVRTVWVIVSVPLAWYLWGLTGVVWAVALSETPVLIVLLTATLYRSGFEVPATRAHCLTIALIAVGCGTGAAVQSDSSTDLSPLPRFPFA